MNVLRRPVEIAAESGHSASDSVALQFLHK